MHDQTIRHAFSIAVAASLLLLGCGRTGLGPFTDEEVADGGLDAGELPEEPDDSVGFVDDEPIDPAPPQDPTCGNGIIDPGELCLLPQIVFWSRIDPCAIDIGDIDGDGHLDVVTPNSDFEHAESPNNYTSVLYGNGQGVLSEPVAYESGDDIPVGVRVGDIDNNGWLDFIVANSDTGTLSVMLNGGGREVFDGGRMSGGEVPIISDLGDINGDGILDVAVSATDEVRVSLGRGDGRFDPPVSYPLSGQQWEVRLVDITHDEALDMVVSRVSEAAVVLFRGDGEGRFEQMGRLDMPSSTYGIADADIDQDGSIDLLFAHAVGVSVMRGDGFGGFTEVSQISAGEGPRDTAIADYDQDGRLDAAVLASGSNDVTLSVGRGTGSFERRGVYVVGEQPSGIAAGDFNEDGVPDLAIANQLSNNIGLILSNP
ncbi:MAG: VCBS repeat-containing protein [Myxococcota bacterium]